MRAMKDSGIEWIGEIPENWDTIKLSYLFNTIGSGTTPNSSNGEFYDGEYSWLQTGDLTDGYITTTSKTITQEAVDTCSALTLFKKGAVVIAMYGATIGKLGILDIDCYTNQACCALSDPINTNSKFIYYWLLCNRENIVRLSLGGGQPNISQGIITNLKVSVPTSITEQTRIADYLDKKCAEIDALIAAKERTNVLLRERRQSIIYEAVTKGLNPDAPMKDSGIEWIGMIPAHWGFSKLKYDAYMKGRIGWQGLKADEFIEEGPYLVTGTDFEDGKIQWERSYHISDERFAEAPEIHLKEQDLLITKDGTIGKLAYVDYLPGPASLNSHLLVIRPKNERFVNKYLYWVLSSDVFLQYTEYAQDGTIMASLSQEKISRFVFGLPSIAEQQSIVDFLDNTCGEMNGLIAANEATIQNLKEYRQSIIYEAVTGKIEI